MSALGAKLEKLLDIKTKQNKYVEFENKKMYGNIKLPTLLRQRHTLPAYFWNKQKNIALVLGRL